MYSLRNSLIILLFFTMTATANPASDSSIKELLAVTQVQNLLSDMRDQVDSLMDNDLQQGLKGKTLTAEQQQAIDNMKRKMARVIQSELSWEKLEPMYLKLYSESFTEEEVTGMLSFYKTPAGQAVINKMPTLMQKTMLEVQQMSAGMTPKLQKIQEEFKTELKATNK